MSLKLFSKCNGLDKRVLFPEGQQRAMRGSLILPPEASVGPRQVRDLGWVAGQPGPRGGTAGGKRIGTPCRERVWV